MSMIARDNGGISIPALEDGVYMAVCCGLIDIGMQKSEQFKTESRKMMIQWQVIGQDFEYNGQMTPRKLQKQYGYSLGNKSNLKKDLEAWRGKAFTEEELKGFDLGNILNVPCQLQILNKERVGKSNYNDIAGIMALPKGIAVPKLTDHELIMLDLEDSNTFQYIHKVQNWIQDRVKQATNFEVSGLKKYMEEHQEDEEGFVAVEAEENISF